MISTINNICTNPIQIPNKQDNWIRERAEVWAKTLVEDRDRRTKLKEIGRKREKDWNFCERGMKGHYMVVGICPDVEKAWGLGQRRKKEEEISCILSFRKRPHKAIGKGRARGKGRASCGLKAWYYWFLLFTLSSLSHK